jgi:hypothetical protein
MKRRLVFLAFWVMGILFPMAWFTRVSATFQRLFVYLFEPVWTHVVMHTLLFAVLAWLLTRLLAPRPPVVVLILVMLVALGQEGVQWLYTGQMPGADEAFDLTVDLLGGGLGVVVGNVLIPSGQPQAEGSRRDR